MNSLLPKAARGVVVVSCVADLGDTTPPVGRKPHGYFRRRLSGSVREALLDWPATAERPLSVVGKLRRSDAQHRGLLFEKKVSDALGVRYGNVWFPQPVFYFRTAREAGRAIPDGILYSPQEIIVVETKFNFRRDDLPQLEEFYLPIVKCAFPAHAVSGLLVCKNLLEYGGIRPYQLLYDRCGLESLRVRRFTQFLIVGRGGLAHIASGNGQG